MPSINGLLLLLIFILIAIFGNCNNSLKTTDKNVVYFENSSILNGNNLQNYSKFSYSTNSKHRRDTNENLCENYCDCNIKGENNFLKIICVLDQNQTYIFGENTNIPPLAIHFLVKLAPNAILRIEENVFRENKLNRISIEGTENGTEQIEIRGNAFSGNRLQYPDIEINNCYKVVLSTKAFNGAFKLNITNCNVVIISANSFDKASINGFFNDIKDLRIQEQAFNNANAKLNLVRCKIDSLYRFEASLREIQFLNCTIGTVNTGTFDVFNINSIVFEQCKIDIFKYRAITEKLLSGHFAITGGIIGIIESEAISGSGISEIVFAKNIIDTIQNNAIHVTAVNVSIVQNRIKHVGHEWLRVEDWSNITISKNQFGNFDYMLLDKKSDKKAHCVFAENLITFAKPSSLNFSSPYCMIREISFYHPCSCDMRWLTILSSRDLKSESYCKVDEVWRYCFNATTFNVQKYEHEVCDESKSKLDCMKNRNLKTFEGDFLQPEELDKPLTSSKLWYIIGGVCTLVIVIIFLIIIIYKFAKTKPTTMPISDVPNTTINTGTILKNLKLFSNDDRRIINQTLDRMKEKYPPDIYEQVYNNTQILLQGKITEMQRVKTIGDIVQILGECQNSGEDFVAFTDILYKHLAPTADDQADPVYAEPNLPNLNVPRNLENNVEGQTNIDHIYAEPNSVQQPLLTNEYAFPADRNEAVGLYTEPISVEQVSGNSNIISPYAVTSPKHHSNSFAQQPSTSKNLPDVLHPSKPMTNVQKLAENFSNNKNLHIIRSPTTNRKIPKYTIPNVRAKMTDKSYKFNGAEPSGNSSTTSDARSDHSGGSDITVKIDDIIEYADA